MMESRPKPFRFQPHQFEEEKLIWNFEGRWKDQVVVGKTGCVLHKKNQKLKEKIKNWVHNNLNKFEKKDQTIGGDSNNF